MWKTVAPTIVTGAIRPISVTGTISTAMPASTQSMMFWQESSLYRKLPVAVTVKIAHRAGDEVGPVAPEELHHLDHPRDAVLGEGARDDRLAASWSGTCRGARRPTPGPRCRRWSRTPWPGTGCSARPSARRTYSTKSVEFARRVSPVRWSRTLSPLEPGTKWTRSPPMSAWASPSRSYSGERARRGLRWPSRPRRAGTGRGPVRVQGQAVVEQAPAHLRPADLHADLGQDPLRLVEDPGDELGLEDVQGRPHQRSSGRCRAGRHQRTCRASASARAVLRGAVMPAMVRDGIPIASRVAPDAPPGSIRRDWVGPRTLRPPGTARGRPRSVEGQEQVGGRGVDLETRPGTPSRTRRTSRRRGRPADPDGLRPAPGSAMSMSTRSGRSATTATSIEQASGGHERPRSLPILPLQSPRIDAGDRGRAMVSEDDPRRGVPPHHRVAQPEPDREDDGQDRGRQVQPDRLIDRWHHGSSATIVPTLPVVARCGDTWPVIMAGPTGGGCSAKTMTYRSSLSGSCSSSCVPAGDSTIRKSPSSRAHDVFAGIRSRLDVLEGQVGRRGSS